MTRRMRAAILALIVAAAPLALIGAGGAVASVPPTVADEPVTTQLADQATTRWAYPARTDLIRTQPSRSGRVIGQLRTLTEDDLLNNYLLLERRQGPGNEDWVHIRVPGRPNGRTGWVRRDALGPFKRSHTVVTVDRKRLRVTVRRAGRVVFRARVGIGARSTPTPRGHFWIREKFKVKSGGLYGPRALGTSAYAPGLTGWPSGGVVGFHGTDEPGLIPGRPSHGCMRLRNRDVLRFYRLVSVGTPVHIR